MVKADDLKREKAKNLRYKKAIAKDVNFDRIKEDLWDIMEECSNVRYYFDSDDGTLVNALEGDEDEAYEFKMMFADLSAECEQMQEDLRCEHIPECFDDFFVAVSDKDFLGWDVYEGDYYGLGSTWAEDLARTDARKRMSRLTKDQMLETAQICFRIFRAYIGIRHRYDCLKAALDILKDENTAHLQLAGKINETYERANLDHFYDWYDSVKEFKNLLDCMPDMAWIQ